MVSAQQRREAVAFLRSRTVSERRGCALVGMSRSGVRYKARERDDRVLAQRLRGIAQKRPRYGYRRAWAELRRGGMRVNHKRVRRVWRENHLGLPQRKRRHRGRKGTTPLTAAYPNHVWTYDFMQDATRDGRALRFLNVEDEYTREGLAIEVGRHLPADAVISVLHRVILERGAPAYLRSDNGTEFTARAIRTWLSKEGIATHYIEPGRPWQNPFGESFNGKFRDECLNVEIFHSVAEARVLAQQWRRYYNHERPHSSLAYRTPEEFRINWERAHPRRRLSGL